MAVSLKQMATNSQNGCSIRSPKIDSMKTTLLPKLTLAGILLTTTLQHAARADFAPVLLTPGSFNQDVVVEQTAPPPVVPATTASMDTGTDNTGSAWYERGFNLDWMATGLPSAGSTVTIGAGMNHSYRFAPSYAGNNVLLIDSTLTSGTLTLAAPVACARLSLLVSGGNGGGSVECEVQHQDGSKETKTVVCHNWLDALNAPLVAFGRINVTAFTFADLNNNRPGLFWNDFDLTNATSPVTALKFNYLSGDSHNAIFAVSGAATADAPFTAMVASGFNADVVVEATATRKGLLLGVTTATQEHGPASGGYTWYERSYYSPVPASGLPAAGGIFTNASAPDHRYVMPPSYAMNNAALLNASSPDVTLILSNPAKFAALSFLGAAGNGPLTIGSLIHHGDGTVETNWFVLPDWLGVPNPALLAQGRVSIDFRMVDLTKQPGLSAQDIPLSNVNSPVTSVDLHLVAGAAGAQGVLFALSGSTGTVPPVRPVLAIVPGPGGSLTLRSSGAGQLQSTSAWAGDGTVWRDEGPISSEVVLQPGAGETARFYRVQVR